MVISTGNWPKTLQGGKKKIAKTKKEKTKNPTGKKCKSKKK